MSAIRSATPEDAKAAWESMTKPSARLVAEHLTAKGLTVNFTTVARWKRDGWTVGEKGECNTPEQKVEAAGPTIGIDASMVFDNPPPADKSDGELILAASREAAHGAQVLLRMVKGSTASCLDQPDKIAKLVDASSDLIEKAIAGFKQAEHVLGSGAKVINVPATNALRPLDTHQLRSAIEAYAAIKRPEKV